MSIGTILIGIVPLCYHRWRYKSRFNIYRRNTPALGKRHDDRIDGERIAGLNIYFLNSRIEFGAYGSLHFHRLDEQRVSPDLTLCRAATEIDLTRQGIGHRKKLEPGPVFFPA